MESTIHKGVFIDYANQINHYNEVKIISQENKLLNNQTQRNLEEEIISKIKNASLSLVNFMLVAIGFVIGTVREEALIDLAGIYTRFIGYALFGFSLAFVFALYFESTSLRKTAEKRPILKRVNLFGIILFFFNAGILSMLCGIGILIGALQAPLIFDRTLVVRFQEILPYVLLPIAALLSIWATIVAKKIIETQ